MTEEAKSPRYMEVYKALRAQILNGTFPEGSLLPSENELCQLHGLTRPTIRHALDALVNDGLIQKRKGKGSIVHAIPTGIGILSISGTTSALGHSHLKTRIIVKPMLREWPEPFMFALSDQERKAPCIYMERLREVDNLPVFFDINFLPATPLPRFTSRNMENRSLFDILSRHYGLEIKGGEQRIRALSADARMASLFGTSQGSPILHLERKLFTNRPGILIYSSIYCDTRNHGLYGTF